MIRPNPVQATAASQVAFTERRGPVATAAKLTKKSRFEDAAELYLIRLRRNRKGSSYDTYRRWLRNEIISSIGKLRGVECTAARLEDYMETLGGRCR